jgi:hypothetical protein
MIKPVDRPIVAGFNQPRPLKAVRKTHVHGAVDIIAPIGTPILAPEDGVLFGYTAYRANKSEYWPRNPQVNGEIFPYANYFYDMYGGVLVLKVLEKGEVKRTHLITHSYGNQIFNYEPFTETPFTYHEEKKESRFPIHAFSTRQKQVKAGSMIGFVGHAGYSTHPHVHWEMHEGYEWQQHMLRLNPEEFIND